MATQQVAPVTCPVCAAQFTAPIESIVNGQNPSQKSALIQGRLNIVQCPQCQQLAPITAPVFYFDLEKELSLVFVPNSLQMTQVEQEKIVGSLTNAVFNALPEEQRKFYLLNPKPFLGMESLIKAVLEADGITEEMYEAQKAKIQLLEEFLHLEDETKLKAKIQENDKLLDREFFEILTASMQAAQYEGNAAGAQALFALRAYLAQESSQGTEIVAEIDKELGIVSLRGAEDLLERLQAAESEDEFEQLIAAGHQMLDYQFFQTLTDQIDQVKKSGDKEHASRLTVLRSKILDVKSQQEEQSRQVFEKSAQLLKTVLQSKDPLKMLEERLDEIDEPFFAILSANIQEAQRQQQMETAQALEMLGNAAMALIQQQSTPPTEEPSAPEAPPKPTIHLP